MPDDTSNDCQNDKSEESEQDAQSQSQEDSLTEARNSVNDTTTCPDKELHQENNCAGEDGTTTNEDASQVFSTENETENVTDDSSKCSPTNPRELETSSTLDSGAQDLHVTPTTTTGNETRAKVEEDIELDLSLAGRYSESSSVHCESTVDKDEASDASNCSVSIDLSEHLEHSQGVQDYENDETCRICHCGVETEPLISPCLCTGTVKHIHHSCLMDWLKRCIKTKCELCLQPISVNRKIKPLTKVSTSS